MLVVVPASGGGVHRPGCTQRGRLAETERPWIDTVGLPRAEARQACSDEDQRHGVVA